MQLLGGIMKMYSRTMQGGTLAKVMVVMVVIVVLIGILAAIAYYNYSRFVTRAKRHEARSALQMIATMQHRFYLQNGTYTTDMTQLGFPVGTGFITESNSYSVSVTVADSNDFKAIATYQKSNKEATKCLTYSIDGNNIQTSSPLADCWTRTR